MRKRALYLILPVTLAGLLLAGCAGMGKKAKKEEDTAEAKTIPAVAAVTVAPMELDERVAVTGTLQPASQVEVGPRIAGRIAWILGKEGTSVQRDQVVARLDDEDARTQVRAAQAAERAAEARLEQAKAGARQQLTNTDAGIKSAEAAVQAAKARLEQAKAAAAQQVTSTDSGIKTAQAALEAAQARQAQAEATADATEASCNAQLKAAQATLDAAQSRLTMLKNGARTQERTIAENAVKLARATYDNANANYERVKKLHDQGAVSKSLLDNAETQMRVTKAQLDTAEQQLSLVQAGPRQEEIDAGEAAVRQAQEGLETARANMKQVDVARANVNIAKTGVSQAKAAVDEATSAKQVVVMRDKDVLAAQAGVSQAQQALESARAGRQANIMRDQEVMAGMSGVQQAQEALALALQHLDDCQVYSPVDGVIASRIAEVGQSIGSNASVLMLTTTRSLYFEASVSELEAPRIRSGQPVEITVDALQKDRATLYEGDGARTVTGRVEKVVPVVNDRTRNFTVRILVPSDPGLFPGMFARGSVIVATHRNAITVAKSALVEKEDGQVVFLLEGRLAKMRPVKLGAADGERVQVISGVLPGDRVIVNGQQALKDGDEVKVTGEVRGQK